MTTASEGKLKYKYIPYNQGFWYYSPTGSNYIHNSNKFLAMCGAFPGARMIQGTTTLSQFIITVDQPPAVTGGQPLSHIQVNPLLYVIKDTEGVGWQTFRAGDDKTNDGWDTHSNF